MADVLVLYPGPASFRQAQVRAHRPLLAELGVRLILADDYQDDGDREAFDGVIALPPPAEVQAAHGVLARELAGRRIDGVLAQSESALGLGALFAAERGLPGPSPQAALCASSKLFARRALEAAGVPQPRYELARDARDVRRFGDAHGWPVVLKPAASALARLVALVRAPAEAGPAVERLLAALPASHDVRRLAGLGALAKIDLGHDPARSFLVESFERGAALEADGVLSGARAVGFGVTAQIMPAPPLFYFEGYLLPADLSERELALAERTSCDALRALELTDTGYSVELRVEARPDGPRAAVIEVNGRLGWDAGFGDLFAAVRGAQPSFLSLQVALGVPVELAPRAGICAAVAYAVCYEDRVVTRVPSAAELEAVRRAHGVQAGLAVWPGERMHAPPSPEVTPHLGWCLATDPTSSRAAYARARAAVDALCFELAPVRRD
jgi:hypothetical protein